MNIEELIENFEFLTDWEDRYKYIIELGSELPVLDEKYYSEEYKVKGCTSQVWFVPEISIDEDGDEVLIFKGDSDAMIVKGIIAIVFTIYSSQKVKNINKIDSEAIFEKLGLLEHLSPNRRNGLVSMVEKIKSYATMT